MRPRLKDVAEHAGVSVKTVSNVVNGYPHVSHDTRTKVEAAIAELAYRPNLSARNLRQGRSGVIALAVPDLSIPYFAELATRVIEAADRHGWTVLIDQTQGERAKELLVVSGIRAQLIDGLLFSPLALTRADLSARSDRTPMVLLGERVGRSRLDHIAVDNIAAARLATTHLIELGRRRVAAIGAQRSASAMTSKQRLRGFQSALGDASLTAHAVAYVRDFHRSDGAAAMAQLLDSGSPPDAVFCFNDTLALGALRTLLSRGVRVPQDVALIGFDDIEDGRFSTPSLSTIAPDKTHIAESAVDLLATRLAGTPGPPPQELCAPHRLLVRETTSL
ncbi:LacI family transcriptional regulator [Nonomuraea polychroma]|uniref:LacI family transcriptional regulator n=1 Tax=Nonomuraea polychroma TaxID=46176 RepID=A0A438MAC7_9ACTN|nr:LacI family DNA-binding transcriptional regulator [Nonomuraea polychroma]RVX42656.1 LacI family transcriptional regulator [Nonomuraea polychroma]